MKRKLISILCIVAIVGASALADIPDLPKFPYKDTVVINFGNNSRILILVDDPQELKRITEFDVNEMINDLSRSMDSLEGEEHYVKIEDPSGERYQREKAEGKIEPGKTIVVDLDDLSDRIKEEIKNEIRSEFDRKDVRKDEKERSRRKNRTNNYFNIEAGMNNYLQEGAFPDENNELYSVKPWGSWYVGVNYTNRTKVAGPLYLDWGVGISWYNFKYQNIRTRLMKGNEGVVYFEINEVNNPIKSKLSLTHLNLNLVPMFSFGHSGNKRGGLFHWDYYGSSFRIGAGAYAGYRIDSWAKYVWEEEGDKEKDRDKSNFYLNNFRYGGKVVIGYKSVDLFFNYDLSELYAEGRGPKLNAFSFGIIL